MKIPATVTLFCTVATWAAAQAPGDWPVLRPRRRRLALLAAGEHHAANVATLQHGLVYRTGDFMWNRGRFEHRRCSVDGTLYLATPLGRVVALDPASGRRALGV